LEGRIANTRQNDRRKGNRRQGSRRKTDIKPIEIEGKEDKEQEVAVRRVTAAQVKVSSVWTWLEEFRVARSEAFLTKKRKRHPRKEE
jgi:hypothetical protein